MSSFANMGPFNPVNFKGGDKVNAVPLFISKLPFMLGGIAGADNYFGRLVSVNPAGNIRVLEAGIPGGYTPRGILVADPMILAADPAMNELYYEGRPASFVVYGAIELRKYLLAESKVPVLGSTIWAKDATGEIVFDAHDVASKTGFTKLNAHVLEVKQPNGVAIWLDYPIATQASTPEASVATPTAVSDPTAPTGTGTSADPYDVSSGTIVTIATTTPGAVIRYTVDGSVPLDTSPIFPAEGLTITDTVRVRAMAMKEGLNPSSIDVYYAVA
jgi:hypothetical protein